MGERTSYPHGTFSWVDLTTSDLDGAKAFYGGLFGWDFEDLPAGEQGVYSMATLGGKRVAAASEGDGSQPPHWNSYITVDDVDELAGRVSDAGGTVAMEPFDVMDAGRMAVIQDPTGAFVCLWTARENTGADVVNVPGALSWNDLNTKDADAARRFYGDLLGWTFKETDGGAPYSHILNDGRSNGGIRPFGPGEEQMVSHWLPYFAVEDIDDAGAKIDELGGHGVFGPMEVSNSGRFAVAQDPQGAFFAVFAGDFDD